MGTIEEVFACQLDRVWLWKHGHLDKVKFKGEILSNIDRLDGEYEKHDIIRATVVHGYVLSITGDLSGCGWDSTTWFQRAEPKVENGVWDFAGLGIDPLDESEGVARVIDGPYKATWLEID